MNFTIPSLLADLFGRANGAVTVVDTDGTSFTDDDLALVADAAAGDEGPVDRSRDLRRRGHRPLRPRRCAAVIVPSRRSRSTDGMIFLIDGDPVMGPEASLSPLPAERDR
jgi:hypothetical protein